MNRRLFLVRFGFARAAAFGVAGARGLRFGVAARGAAFALRALQGLEAGESF